MSYPVIKDTYRFRGGWLNMPSQLGELTVGRGYEITPSGDEYIVRGSSKLIMVDEESFKKYFEPFIDYLAEPEEIVSPPIETSSTVTHNVEVNCNIEAHSNTDIEQLSLF